MKKITNVKQVALWRLCVGCGACKYICPDDNVNLVDVINDGIRPILESDDCQDCRKCLEVCPGYGATLATSKSQNTFIQNLTKSFGPVLEIWEGYAADPEIRFNGSSGGLSSVLALYCMEKKGMKGILHIGADQDYPWKNRTVLSKKREELILRTGSRYSPASPCDSINQLELASGPCVFIGKPCDVTGLRSSQVQKQKLNSKIGLAISFFCAGTPSTQGTLDFFYSHNVKPEDVDEFRYRGKGWPGMATVKFKRRKSPLTVSYENSWGFLQKYRPFRCYLCPDLTGEFADISFGDAWYREINNNDPGHSLILVRTKKGREIFHEAMKSGYVTAKEADSKVLYLSQKNLLKKRQAIWGRLFAMKVLGIPTPKLKGFHLFKNWRDLPTKEKFFSIVGTMHRAVQRKYFKPIKRNDLD
jgi:coenzyme F420 hydrogenase subunit beta